MEQELTQAEKTTNLLDSFYPTTAEKSETVEEKEPEQELTEVESESDRPTEDAEVEEGSEDPIVDGEPDGAEELVYDVDGEEMTLAEIREAKKGAMLQADYTRKTQDLAKQREGIEEEKAKIAESRGKLDEIVTKLSESITETTNEIDFDFLRESNPSEYLKQKEDLQAKEKALNEAKQAQQNLQQEELKTLISSEQTLLLESNPDWQDKKVMESDIQLMNDFIAETFTEQESAQLINHKVMNLVRDAAKYKKIVANGDLTKKKVKQAPKAIKPSARKVTKSQQLNSADKFYS